MNSTNQTLTFLNETQLNEIFDDVYLSLNEIPYENLSLDEDDREDNGYNFITENLLSKIIDNFKLSQPRTYEYLKKGKFFYAVEKTWLPQDMSDITQFGIIINDKVFYIEYPTYCYYANSHLLKYMPQFILDTWLCDIGAWSVAEKSTINIDKTRLPSSWCTPIQSVFGDFRSHSDEYCKFLSEKFNKDFRCNYEDEKYNDTNKYFQLLLLFDTRNTDEFDKKTGFQLFISTHNDKKDIYVITNGDIFSIKKLKNAQQAIDNYAQVLFSEIIEEFDFSSYLIDF